MEIKELQDIIQQNGVVGAGGAGFPTYMKLTDKANTILMNCAECVGEKLWPGVEGLPRYIP